MNAIPSDWLPDRTIFLLSDPYRFISKYCDSRKTDLFETRLQLQKTICLRGREAAKLIYNKEYFTRVGAAPVRIQKTLFGIGAVQGLDGPEHLHRKQLFLSLVTPDRVAQLVALAQTCWLAKLFDWQKQQQVILYDAVQPVLTEAACHWAGLELADSDIGPWAHDLTLLFDKAGNAGPTHYYTRSVRKRLERKLANFITEIRQGKITPAPETAAAVIAQHRDLSGQLLEPRIAAVELLNVVRPIVAVSVYLTFVVHALHLHRSDHTGWKGADDPALDSFVQEVRRFYPFFPAIPAVTRKEFEWNGYLFPAGRRVLLDLYGTNHDARIWKQPEEFRPERFLNWQEDPFALVPQGGGERSINHRCPGEDIALELMKLTARIFTEQVTYEVPPQNLQINYRRIPALPGQRLILKNVCIR